MILRSESQEERQSVIDEAMTWVRAKTPYHNHARVKGSGADCLGLIIEVFERTGLVPHIDPGYYSPEWHLHHSEELYWQGILQYAKEFTGQRQPKMGDVVLVKFGRAFSHGAIVKDWPEVIHAWFNRSVETCDLEKDSQFWKREMKFFTLWE